MYETCLDLKDRPFSAVPRPDHYFPASAIETARMTLVRCIERGEGVALIIGSAGTGKSMLCEVLAERFESQFQIALLTGGHIESRRALLQAVLYELGQPYRGMDEGELRLALVDYVTLDENCDRGILLLVDEGHHLSLRLLDEVRAMTNLMRRHQPAVRLVMAGNHALEERFASPKLDSLSQRVSARCYLESFGQSETQAYIHSRIAMSGGRGISVFPADTCQMVHKATDGVPRLINQLCDHVLLLAQAAGLKRIAPNHIEEAWADLQQLPARWTEAQRVPSGAAGDVVEFGVLDDDDTNEPSNEMPASDMGALSHDEAESRDADRPCVRLADVPDDDPFEATSDFEDSQRKLSHIQQLLEDVQAEFRPKGSTMDVELVFEEATHPFHEDFEEEEVIADRYANIEMPQAVESQGAFSPLGPSSGVSRSAELTSVVPATFAALPTDVLTTTSWHISHGAIVPAMLPMAASWAPLASAMLGDPSVAAPSALVAQPSNGPAQAAEVTREAAEIAEPATAPKVIARKASKPRKATVVAADKVGDKPPRPTTAPSKAFGQLFGKLRRAT